MAAVQKLLPKIAELKKLASYLLLNFSNQLRTGGLPIYFAGLASHNTYDLTVINKHNAVMKILLVAFLFVNGVSLRSQNVSINTDGAAPHASAMDVKSTVKGMLRPLTSTTSRLAILNPAKGLIIYDITTSGFWFHNGTAWTQISRSSGGGWRLTGNAAVAGMNLTP